MDWELSVDDLRSGIGYTAPMHGRIIKERRQELGLTQQQLAALIGMSQQGVSDYEAGRCTPQGARLAKVIQVLGLAQEFAGVQVRVPRKLKRFALPGTQEAQVDPGSTWATFGEQVERRFSPERLPCLAFRKITRADSRWEVRALCSLAEAGALPCIVSPIALGFLRHPVVTADGWSLGLRGKPTLFRDLGNWSYSVTPQPTLRLADTTVRPDALVRVADAHRSIWCVYEIDGRQHEHTRILDQRRDKRLEMDVFRFGTHEFSDQTFATMLENALITKYGLQSRRAA